MENYYKILKVYDWECIHTKQWLLDLQKSIKIDKCALDMIGSLNGKFLLLMEKGNFKYFDQINGELLYDSIQNFKPYQIEGDEYIKQVNYFNKFSYRMIAFQIKSIEGNNQSIEDNKELFLKYLNLKTGKRIIISDSKLDTQPIGKYLYNLYQTNNKPVLYVNCKGDFESTNKNLEKSLKLLYTNETNQRLALPSNQSYFSRLIFCLLRKNVNVILNEFHQLYNIPNMIDCFIHDLGFHGSAQNGTLFVLSSDEKKMINIFSSERNLYMRFFPITT
ncbi:hypothetical protein ACTFIY_003115 [Dictyostelium cf. discoideum]